MSKTMMLFPGQGTQYVGMGKSLYSNYPIIKQTFEEAEDTLGLSISKLCFEGPLERLSQTANAQVAILVLSVAAFRQFQEMHDTKPTYMAGHSLGEYSALVCAEAASYEEILKVVHYRGQIMSEAAKSTNGSMLAVEYDDSDLIEQECKLARENGELVWIGAYNTSNQIVLTGQNSALEKMGKRLEKLGGEITPLSVSGAFHSPLMDQAAILLKEKLLSVNWMIPKYKVISNSTGCEYSDSRQLPSQLALQMTNPVLWKQTLEIIANSQINSVIGFPPKNIFEKMVSQTRQKTPFHSIQTQEDLVHFTGPKRVDILARMLVVSVGTRNFNSNVDDFKLNAVKPYKELESLHKEYLFNHVLTTEVIEHALSLFSTILDTKKIQEDKKQEIFQNFYQDFHKWFDGYDGKSIAE